MTPGTCTVFWQVSAKSLEATSFCLVAQTRPKIDLSRIRLSSWGPSLSRSVRVWLGSWASGFALSPSGRPRLLLWSGTKGGEFLASRAVFSRVPGPFPSSPGLLPRFWGRPPAFGSLSPGTRGGSTFPRFGSPSSCAPGSASVCRRSAPGRAGPLLRAFRASSLRGGRSLRSLGRRRDCHSLSLFGRAGLGALLARDFAGLPPLLEWKVLVLILLSTVFGSGRVWARAGLGTDRRCFQSLPLLRYDSL